MPALLNALELIGVTFLALLLLYVALRVGTLAVLRSIDEFRARKHP